MMKVVVVVVVVVGGAAAAAAERCGACRRFESPKGLILRAIECNFNNARSGIKARGEGSCVGDQLSSVFEERAAFLVRNDTPGTRFVEWWKDMFVPIGVTLNRTDFKCVGVMDRFTARNANNFKANVCPDTPSDHAEMVVKEYLHMCYMTQHNLTQYRGGIEHAATRNHTLSCCAPDEEYAFIFQLEWAKRLQALPKGTCGKKRDIHNEVSVTWQTSDVDAVVVLNPGGVTQPSEAQIAKAKHVQHIVHEINKMSGIMDPPDIISLSHSEDFGSEDPFGFGTFVCDCLNDV